MLQFLLQILSTFFLNQSLSTYSTNYYYISFSLTIVITYILIDQFIYFYTQIIPFDFRLLGLMGYKSLYYVSYIGKIGGCLISLLAVTFENEKFDEEGSGKSEQETFMILVNISAIVLQFILMLIFMCNKKRFKDRPIRRLIYNKNIRKLKRIEF